MQRRGSPKGPAPWLYLVATLLWTWSFLGLANLTGQHYLQFPTALLGLAGGFGPLIIALIMIGFGYWDDHLDKSATHFLKRVLNPFTLPSGWYVRIIGLLFVMQVLPLLFEPSLIRERGIFDVGPLSFILVGFIFGGLEEVGWRGYAQEALQRRMPVLFSALVIGVFWAAWHLPLFFLEGTYQSRLGVGTPEFWQFNIAIMIGTVIYGWLYNASGRIAFAAVFFHAMGNLGGEFFVDASYSMVVDIALALILIIFSWRQMREAAPGKTTN